VVDESPLAVDLDHRQPLAVTRLEFPVARDVDLDELEPELVARDGEKGTRPVAKAAAGRVIERDDGLTDRDRAWWSPRRHA
jgi:hypothetical protein